MAHTGFCAMNRFYGTYRILCHEPFLFVTIICDWCFP